MTYDQWKTTNPDDQWLGPDPDEPDKLTDPEMKQIVEAIEKARPQIEADPFARQERISAGFKQNAEEKNLSYRTKGSAQLELDYTQDAEDVMLIQYCLALGMQDLLKREAIYANSGGWCLGRVHADIARCHALQDKYSRCFETVMRDCGE